MPVKIIGLLIYFIVLSKPRSLYSVMFMNVLIINNTEFR